MSSGEPGCLLNFGLCGLRWFPDHLRSLSPLLLTQSQQNVGSAPKEPCTAKPCGVMFSLKEMGIPWEHLNFQDTQPAVWPIPLLSGLLFNFLTALDFV